MLGKRPKDFFGPEDWDGTESWEETNNNKIIEEQLEWDKHYSKLNFWEKFRHFMEFY